MCSYYEQLNTVLYLFLTNSLYILYCVPNMHSKLIVSITVVEVLCIVLSFLGEKIALAKLVRQNKRLLIYFNFL